MWTRRIIKIRVGGWVGSVELVSWRTDKQMDRWTNGQLEHLRRLDLDLDSFLSLSSQSILISIPSFQYLLHFTTHSVSFKLPFTLSNPLLSLFMSFFPFHSFFFILSYLNNTHMTLSKINERIVNMYYF